DEVAPWIGRISLGGLGRLAGAAATDVVTTTMPGQMPMPALAAELLGQPTPAQQQAQLEESAIRSGLVQGAQSLPTVAAGMAIGGPLAIPGMASAMGAQA